MILLDRPNFWQSQTKKMFELYFLVVVVLMSQTNNRVNLQISQPDFITTVKHFVNWFLSA